MLPHNCFYHILFSEFEGVGKKGTFLCSCDWLDVVLPGDRLLPKELGSGSQESSAESAQPSWLPRKLLGIFVKILLHIVLWCQWHFITFQISQFLNAQLVEGIVHLFTQKWFTRPQKENFWNNMQATLSMWWQFKFSVPCFISNVADVHFWFVYSSCCTVRAHGSQKRSTRLVWRWQRRKASLNSSITFFLGPRAFGSRSRTSGERVRASWPLSNDKPIAAVLLLIFQWVKAYHSLDAV